MPKKLTLSSALLATVLAAVLLPLSAGAATPGTISGTVAGTGFPLTSLRVSIDGEDAVPVGSDGAYTAPGLTPGKHQLGLVYNPESGDTQFVDYAPLTVVSGTTKTYNMSFTKITGHVTRKDTGGALANAGVYVYDSADGFFSTDTDSSGVYRLLARVRPVTYTANFQPGTGAYLGRYFGNAVTEAKATRFSLDKTAVKVISIALPRAAFLKGSLSVPKGAGADGVVTLYKVGSTTAGQFAGQQVAYAENGHPAYTSYGLEAGTYRVGFGRASGYALAPGRLYNNTSEAHPSQAATVTLTNGATRTLAAGQSADPKRGGKFSGSVYKISNGRKVGRSGLRVVAVPTNKLLSTRSAETGAGGRYVIPGLAPGEYKIYVWNSRYPSPGTKSCVQQGLGTHTAHAAKTTVAGARKFTATYRQYC